MSMKFYSEAKYRELKVERQLRLMLELIKAIEICWESPFEKKQKISLFKKYFQWSDFYESNHDALKKMAHLSLNIREGMSLRSLLDLAVPMERFLNLSIKDENLFQITTQDFQNKDRVTYPVVIVLDHLRSAFNVGSVFRTAECLGVEHIYLVGYTPTPEDQGVKKTSMGTETQVPWSHWDHIIDVIEKLKNENRKLVALETVTKGESLENFVVTKDSLALFAGNERFGLTDELLSQMDSCLSIPMMGIKNSLNVSNSLSIATFEMIRQWRGSGC